MRKTRKTALVLAAGLVVTLAFSAAVYAEEEKGPGIGLGTGIAQTAQETQATGQTQSGEQAQTTVKKEAPHRKTAEELQQVMQTVPAGPAKAEWGTFFLGNNLPPRNDEEEPYLRSFHA